MELLIGVFLIAKAVLIRMNVLILMFKNMKNIKQFKINNNSQMRAKIEIIIKWIL